MDTATRVTLATCAVIVGGSVMVGARMHAVALEQTVPNVRLLACPGSTASLTHYLLSDVWRFTELADELESTLPSRSTEEEWLNE